LSQKQRAAARDALRTQPADGGVVIAWIHPGEVSSYFLESMLTTTLSDFARGPDRRIVNYLQDWSSANVSASRNTVTQRFLDMGVGDWLLWVDADMQWTPDAIDLILASADPTERPIVGGLCFGMAEGGLVPTIYQWAQLEEGITTVRLPTYERDAVIQVAATGAAFLLVHRSALETIAARQFSRAFPFFQETEHLGKPVGEDLTFCIRAGQCGIPVYVNTAVKIGHHKSQLLTEDVFDSQPKGVS
jgi:hypothetical protein